MSQYVDLDMVELPNDIAVLSRANFQALIDELKANREALAALKEKLEFSRSQNMELRHEGDTLRWVADAASDYRRLSRAVRTDPQKGEARDFAGFALDAALEKLAEYERSTLNDRNTEGK